MDKLNLSGLGIFKHRFGFDFIRDQQLKQYLDVLEEDCIPTMEEDFLRWRIHGPFRQWNDLLCGRNFNAVTKSKLRKYLVPAEQKLYQRPPIHKLKKYWKKYASDNAFQFLITPGTPNGNQKICALWLINRCPKTSQGRCAFGAHPRGFGGTLAQSRMLSLVQGQKNTVCFIFFFSAPMSKKALIAQIWKIYNRIFCKKDLSKTM